MKPARHPGTGHTQGATMIIFQMHARWIRSGILQSGGEGTAWGFSVPEAAVGCMCKALELQKTAIAAGQTQKHDAHRDLNIAVPFEGAQLQDVLA